MRLINKFLFPFFKLEKHNFLLKKWWFRALIVLYIVVLFSGLYLFYIDFYNGAAGWCWDGLSYLYEYKDLYFNRLNECKELQQGAVIQGIEMALLETFILNYLVQIVFFKVIINFIYLGSKNK